jgi:RNA polymerase sigma-70 factor (ECF subfamily)
MTGDASKRRNRALDELVVLRCQAGDRPAFDLLVERWHPRLLRLVRRLTQEHEVGELLQEVWLSVFTGLGGLRDPAHFATWAYRLASNKSVDWIRRRQRDRTLERTVAEEPLAVLARAGMVSEAKSRDGHGDVALLRSGLSQLSPAHRTVVDMYYLDELSLAQIAEALSLPEGTVKSRLFHARKRLREHMEDSA